MLRLKDYKYIATTHSTNALLKDMLRGEALPEFFVVRTAFQTAGKGQMGNSWESERSKNLLFSMLLRPHHIFIQDQFVLSQLVSVGLIRALAHVGVDARVKWPNDIYVGDKKIAGILIENSLRNARIDTSVVGVGLNVNQIQFVSDAPNPISIKMLVSKTISVRKLLKSFREEFESIYPVTDLTLLKQTYMKFLYRSTGVFRYKLPAGMEFNASIEDVCQDGQLILKSDKNEITSYYFKEIEFVL